MTADPRTLAAYNARAADYAARFDSSPKRGAQLRRFMEALPPSARVLDLGCGPGGASVHMANAGFDVDPVDASPEMVALAKGHGLPARLGTFDDLDAREDYDGIWANFSLLHAPRAALPRHLAAIAAALRPSGLFHIGLKTGEGERRDALDRLYTYVKEAELAGLLTAAGLAILETDTGCEAGLAGTEDAWIVHMCRKT